MHDAYIGRHSENNIKCVVHDDLGQKNRTTGYNCRFSASSLALLVTGDFLSFIVVEHIRFFHVALQLIVIACPAHIHKPVVMKYCGF